MARALDCCFQTALEEQLPLLTRGMEDAEEVKEEGAGKADGDGGEEGSEGGDAAEELPEDLSSLKVAELKEKLKARGLSMQGRHEVLVERLQSAIDAEKSGGAAMDDNGEA